jgi:preprotein translocase subunit YajC
VNIAGLLPILLLGVVFWALLIRPQQRAKAAARLMQTALSPGDEVSTVGGIFGIVRDIDAATVDLEISEDVIVRFDRRAVNRIVRDIPAEEGDQHRIGDDEVEDDELVSEAPVVTDEPAGTVPPNDDVSDTVDAPEPAR